MASSSRPFIDVSKMHSLVEKIVEENNAMLLKNLKKFVNDVAGVEPDDELEIEFENDNHTTQRIFSTSESSAIYSLEINDDTIDVVFQSNRSRTYRFSTTDDFRFQLIEIISDENCKGVSVGRLIHDARLDGNLASH